MITKSANIVTIADGKEMIRMPRGTYDDTHERIVESAMRMFLENGFERTNLRDLSKAAGITTGAFYRHFTSKEDVFSALVKPTVEELSRMFTSGEEACKEALDRGDVGVLWNTPDTEVLVDFIYRHFDQLKLLLKCADGTPYSDFVNDVVTMETTATIQTLGLAKERGLVPGNIPAQPEMHMICHAYISSLFEAVMHDFSKEEMLTYVGTMREFFMGGSERILGF